MRRKKREKRENGGKKGNREKKFRALGAKGEGWGLRLFDRNSKNANWIAVVNFASVDQVSPKMSIALQVSFGYENFIDR